MKKISEFKSRKEWEDFLWSKFLENAERARSEKQLKNFLDNLLSANEKKLIIKRLTALAMIKAGKSYKEIEEILWISPSTISALKKSIEKQSGYQSNRYYAKKSKSEKIEKHKKGLPPQKTILDYWLNFPFPTKGGKRWKFLNYQG
ncbi:MAG: Trp family transcriptional regulator [bacterium]|nr:Trp family transcriptional regulator [bacterium]